MIGQRGRVLLIKSQRMHVQFIAPQGWKTRACTEVALDSHLVVSNPRSEEVFSVTVSKNPPHCSESDLQIAYLGAIRHTHDSDIRSDPEEPFQLADGRKVTPYRCYSSYWGEHYHCIILEGAAHVTFDFSAPSLSALRASRKIIQRVLDSYSYERR